MKKLTLLILLLMAYSVFAQTEKVTISADTWMPYNGEQNSPMPGYMIEIAEKVFSAENIRIDYKTMPWTRAVKMTETGYSDCVVGSDKYDTPHFIFPEEEWGIDSTLVFVKKGDKWRYQGIDSIKHRKIGTIQDYSYGAEFDAYFKSVPDKVIVLTGDNALETNIRKLIGGRIDTLFENKMVLEAKLKELNLSDALVIAGDLLPRTPLYIACSPGNIQKSKRLTAIVDKQTKILRQSGELEKIMLKYGLHDWKK